MPRFIQVITTIFAVGVIANTVLIIFSALMDAATTPHAAELVQQRRARGGLNECCAEQCHDKTREPTDLDNYKDIVKQVPRLDPSYHNLMVRLGTDVKLDLRRCPANALMRNRSLDFSPEHLNCPTLFLVGARKGGTSSLYHYISRHPDFEGTSLLAGPKVGETFYFSKFYKLKTWDSYISLFPSGGRMTGDASVGNLVHSLAPRRLYVACGKQARVVILLRDPVKRLESNFLMRSRLHTTKIGNQTSISVTVKMTLDIYFQEVLKKTLNMNDLPTEWSKLVGLFPPSRNMVFEGVYYVHLLNWLCNFPAENILIINSEEFFRNPSKILDLVFQFLDLKSLDSDTYNWITSATYNRGDYNVPSFQTLTRTDIANLLGAYRPFNKALFEFLQWDDHSWLM